MGDPIIEHREIRCRHSESLPALLTDLRLSVLISTYLTGHVVTAAAHLGRMRLTFHQFERAMGIAVKPGTLAVCTTREVWFLREAPDIAAKLTPAGFYDKCYIARTSHFTDDIRAHEAAWVGNEFLVVNTLFSCLAALHPFYSFASRWRPAFVSELRPEDRCHLNGLALADGRPRYVTALAQTDTAEGWRARKADGGCVIDVATNRIVAGGLALPHSPRLLAGKVYFLHSGLGRLEVLDPATGHIDVVADLPGVARGLALHGGYAFIGLSRARLSLDGVPIVDRRDQLQCGLVVVELRTGKVVADMEFSTGVDEIFDVQILPGVRSPYIAGPWSQRDTGQPFWTMAPSTGRGQIMSASQRQGRPCGNA